MNTQWFRHISAPSASGIKKTEVKSPLFKQTNKEAWSLGLAPHVSYLCPSNLPSIIAVGGGKGGVGKSIVSANLAAKIASFGHKVLLVDLDIGGANLHTYFGVGMPAKTILDLIGHSEQDFKKVIIPTPADRVFLIPGGKDESLSELSDFGTSSFTTLWEGILNAKERLDAEFVILDLGAGVHRHTIDFFTAAHMGIVTILPEPTSIENAYSFIKATLLRLIENVGAHQNRFSEEEKIKESLFTESSLKGPNHSHLAKMQKLSSLYPELIEGIFKALSARYLGFVINQIRSQKDIDIAASMGTICQKFFGFNSCALGYLNYDEAAWKALRNKRLLVLDFPHSILARRISEIALNSTKILGYI